MIVSLDNLQLSDQIVASCQEDGFWIGPTLFDGHEAQTLRREVMRTTKGQRDFDVPYWAGNEPHYDPTSLGLTHIVNAWWVNARIREVTSCRSWGRLPQDSWASQRCAWCTTRF